MLDQLFRILDVFDKLSRIFLCDFADLRKLHAQRCQWLSRAVVQFPCYVPTLEILRLHEPPGKVTQLRVFFLKFLSAELHFRVERIGQCSVTRFAFTQLSLNSFALAVVPSNFRRPDDLPAGVPDRRNGERNIDRCLVFTNPNGVEMFDSFTSLDSVDNDSFFVSTI